MRQLPPKSDAADSAIALWLVTQDQLRRVADMERSGMKATKKKVLVAIGLASIVGCSGVAFLLFKAGKAVIRAEGAAFYSGVGAWSRIQEYARAQGKANYTAEADKTVAQFESEITSWRSSAEAVGLDLAEFEKMRKTAYETTDRNIRNGHNPLAHLDRP